MSVEAERGEALKVTAAKQREAASDLGVSSVP